MLLFLNRYTVSGTIREIINIRKLFGRYFNFNFNFVIYISILYKNTFAILIKC